MRNTSQAIFIIIFIMGRRQKAKIQEQDLNINLIYCNVSLQK
jgi:hypothetical protein